MKKIIKRIIIIVVILAIIVGGIFAGMQYSNSKKTATVSLASNYGMSDYWGDSISSSGTVASQGAQSVYVTSSDSIASINVTEGDLVNEGDVLMTLKSETQDIAGKTLELDQAKATLTIYQNKLNKLMSTQPVPDANYIASSNDERDIEYVGSRIYTLKADNFGYSLSAEGQSAGKVAEKYYDINGDFTAAVYYTPDGGTLDEDKFKEQYKEAYDALNGDSWADYFNCQEQKEIYTYVKYTFYYDSLNGNKILGEDQYDINGNLISKFTPQTGYTATQLNDEIISAKKSVQEQDLAVRKCQSELDTMLSSTNGGVVYAKTTGKVAKLQDKDNININKPFMTITATEDFYIEGSIGEFYLDLVHEGDVATVSSWESGVSTEATITSISDRPDTSGNYYSSSGNTNSSAYVFKASFDQSSGIEIGEAVDISITPTTSEDAGNAFYLQTSLIRKDAGGSYVMKMDENNQLEKVYVKVGKNVYNYYTEIKSGLTADDYVAFPYGNGAVVGMNCTVADYLEE